MRVLILSAAPSVTDARVRVTARTLAALGHDVDVICRTAAAELEVPLEEDLGGARLRRVNFNSVSSLDQHSGLSTPGRWAHKYVSLLSQLMTKFGWSGAARVVALTQEFWTIAPHAENILSGDGDHRPDVVHAVGLPALPSAGRLAKRWRARLIYDSVELEQDRNSKYFRPFNWLRMRLESIWIKRADAVVTVSDEISKHLVRQYDIAKPKVIYNIAAPHASTETIRDVLSAPPDAVLAVYIGAAAFGRGLIPSLEMLRAAPEVHLGIVGPREERFRKRFELAAKTLDVSDRVGMALARPPTEAPGFVSTANVALALLEPVCLSYAFALPNKLFQAVQAGLPIIVGRTPALVRIVSRYDLGESVDERDSAAVAEAVRRQAARHGTGEYRAARARFLSDYDENMAVTAWARLYASVVSDLGDNRHIPVAEHA